MKARIIKTSAGYVPQVQLENKYWEDKGLTWYSLGGMDLDTWSEPEHIKRYCTYFTQWGAKRVLKKWIRSNAKGTKALEVFKQELENPNVVYEVEV